jgi:hypothetical protein
LKAIEYAIDEWYEPVILVFLGDLHLGASNVDEKLIQDVATRLAGDNVYWVDLGDSIDAINRTDPRFDPSMLPEWIGMADLTDLPRAQVSRYKHYFGRLGENCLARLYGNHEMTLQRKYERNVYGELNRAIELKPERALGYSGFIRLRFRYRRGKTNKVSESWTQTIYIHHGASNGRLAGGKALNLERLALGWEADVYAVGHSHTKLVLQKRVLGMQSKKNVIEDKQKVMINVGAFMDGSTGYAERKGLYPQSLGPVELHFLPSRKHIRVIQ